MAEMTQLEKAKKYDLIRDWLWSAAVGNNLLAATMATVIIRQLRISGPYEQEPDDA